MNPVELTSSLIKIPSISRSETATGIQDFIATLVNGEIQGFLCRGEPCGYNVIAISEPIPGHPFILLNGHHDTVAPAEGWGIDPVTPEKDGDKLYGLGAHDMKSGLAIAITLYLEFRDTLNLIFTSSGDEESDSLGSFALFDERNGPLKPYLPRISGAMITEPTHERIMLGARGRYALTLKVHGKAAHGARPAQGINAIERAADMVTAMKRLPVHDHPRLGKSSHCVLKILGGTETLSVPDSCEIVVDRHISHPMKEEEAIREFRDALSSLEVDYDISLVEREVPFLKPYEIPLSNPFVQTFLSSFDVQQRKIKDGSILYGESVGDYNIFGAIMPTIVYGPKGGNHHSANEFVLLSSIKQVHQDLRSWLQLLISQH